MPFDTSTIQGIVLATMTTAILGGLKYLGPRLRGRVPNFMWPIAALALAWVGTQACSSLEAECSGNPLVWGSEEATAVAVAFLAMLQREFFKSIYPRVRDYFARAAVSITTRIDR